MSLDFSFVLHSMIPVVQVWVTSCSNMTIHLLRHSIG